MHQLTFFNHSKTNMYNLQISTIIEDLKVLFDQIESHPKTITKYILLHHSCRRHPSHIASSQTALL